MMAARRSAAAWAETVKAWRRSGLTARQFAEARGISVPTLRWWAWRHAAGAPRSAPGAKAFVEVVAVDLASAPTAPVHARGQRAQFEARVSSGVTLELDGVVVRLDPNFDEATLQRALAAIARSRSC